MAVSAVVDSVACDDDSLVYVCRATQCWYWFITCAT